MEGRCCVVLGPTISALADSKHTRNTINQHMLLSNKYSLMKLRVT